MRVYSCEVARKVSGTARPERVESTETLNVGQLLLLLPPVACNSLWLGATCNGRALLASVLLLLLLLLLDAYDSSRCKIELDPARPATAAQNVSLRVLHKDATPIGMPRHCQWWHHLRT
jgi:hypothetical protein